MTLLGPGIELLAAGARFADLRHALLANNLANLETPAARARELTFAQALGLSERVRALPVADQALQSLDLRLVDSPDRTDRPDGNTIDLDHEMARLADNTIYQATVLRLLGANLGLLRMAIRGQP